MLSEIWIGFQSFFFVVHLFYNYYNNKKKSRKIFDSKLCHRRTKLRQLIVLIRWHLFTFFGVNLVNKILTVFS